MPKSFRQPFARSACPSQEQATSFGQVNLSFVGAGTEAAAAHSSSRGSLCSSDGSSSNTSSEILIGSCRCEVGALLEELVERVPSLRPAQARKMPGLGHEVHYFKPATLRMLLLPAEGLLGSKESYAQLPKSCRCRW